MIGVRVSCPFFIMVLLEGPSGTARGGVDRSGAWGEAGSITDMPSSFEDIIIRWHVARSVPKRKSLFRTVCATGSLSYSSSGAEGSLCSITTSRQNSGSNIGTMAKACQCNKDNRHEATAASSSSVSQRQTMHIHRHVPHSCYAKSNPSLSERSKPFLGVFLGHVGPLSCALPIYGAHQSSCYAHTFARQHRPYLSPSPAILLSSPHLCPKLTLLSCRPTSD
jgi:hypothetical protein